jgi:hypothetical protein
MAIGGTILFATLRPRQAEGVYRTFERSRKTIGGIFAILVSWTLVRSGRPMYILAALVMIALATLYWWVERPDKEVI